MLNLAIFASGEGTNLQAIMDAIDRGDLKASLVKVISDNPQAPALTRAEKKGISSEVFIPKNYSSLSDFENAILHSLKKAKTEYIALAGYMRILSPLLIRAYPHRILNIHPSLLPSFPGLHAVSKALEYGTKVTGCTVHFVDEGCDTGPVIAQRIVSIAPEDTLDTLTEKIHREEHKLYPEVLQWIAEGRIKVNGRKVFIQERSQK